MKLYFAPLACSMASRIVVDELSLPVELVEVDPIEKRLLATGEDYRRIHPLALVPALGLDDGRVLTENVAILPFLGDLDPEGRLAPRDPEGRLRLMEWLGFVATELHKSLYAPLLARDAPAAVKEWTLARGRSRLARLDAHLTGREFLLDRFSVVDAYLVTILHWTQATAIDVGPYPAVRAYLARHLERPSVARAVATELPLYRAELARRKAKE